jgi:hypothetical protein
MTAIRRFQTTGAMVVLAASALVAGAQRRGANQAPPMYGVATEVTLAGTVDEVKTIPGPGMQGGTPLLRGMGRA